MIRARQTIPFNRPALGPEEARAASDVILSGSVSGNGSVGALVERELERLLSARHVLLVTSCTHAMELAFMALGIGPGHDILVPSFTFVSTANAVLSAGARPVFVDIRIEDLTVDPESVVKHLGRRSKAMVVVHYAGVSCQMDDLNGIAKNSGLFVVEDAAHAIGARWKDRCLGNAGDVGCISFHGTKNLVCGEGGAFVTSSDEVARAAELIREKGTNRSAFLRGEVDKYTWVSKGSSYVLSDIMAAILKIQLEKIDRIQAERRILWQRYQEALVPLRDRGLLRLCTVPEHADHNWHIFYLLARTPAERDGLIRHLGDRGIEATFHFVPLHRSPFAVRHLGTGNTSLPVTEYVCERLLRLPIYPGLSHMEQDRVIDAVASYFSRGRSPAGSGGRRVPGNVERGA